MVACLCNPRTWEVAWCYWQFQSNERPPPQKRHLRNNWQQGYIHVHTHGSWVQRKERMEGMRKDMPGLITWRQLTDYWFIHENGTDMKLIKSHKVTRKWHKLIKFKSFCYLCNYLRGKNIENQHEVGIVALNYTLSTWETAQKIQSSRLSLVTWDSCLQKRSNKM